MELNNQKGLDTNKKGSVNHTEGSNTIKTFELYRDTYYRAANKVHKTQPKRHDILKKHGDKMGIYTHPFIPRYKMDIYVHFALDNTNGDMDEIYPNEVIEDVIIEDYFEVQDHNMGAFTIQSDKYFMYIFVELDPVKIVLFDVSNKFANRRSANIFIRLMHEFYKTHDPNTKGRVLSKLNDVEHSELTYKDVDELSNFWGFLHSNGYDWDRFRRSININDLWDSYS